MRTNKWGIGVVVIAAIMLTGCSTGASDKPAADKGSGSSSDVSSSKKSEESTSDCPELKEGLTIDSTTLSTCTVKALDDVAGYAATMNLLSMEATAKYNPSEKAIEMDLGDLGSIITIGDDSWVKPTGGTWQLADPNSSDPLVSGLSAAATNALMTDTAAIAASLSGDFTVTGTAERLGEKVYIVEGSVEQSGASADMTFEITSDYGTLATSAVATANGQTLDTKMVVTEWDVKQDIVAPL